MNRRMALLAAGAIALAGMGAVAARQLGGSSGGEGKVTLKSRILDYEKSLKSMRSRPSPEEIDEHITAMMGEYFRIGMSYEEVVKILGENDLAVDSSTVNSPDGRFSEPAFFDLGVVSTINIPTLVPLLSFIYNIFLGFNKNRVVYFAAFRIGTGP